jgi:peptidoglycan/LPS O-acetylase OafA/YrhL
VPRHMQLIHALDEAPQVSVHKERRFYQPELDGLRFYAFAGVFVCHALPLEDSFYRRLHLPMAWFWGAAVRSGAAGVDLFFALSAFLITSLLLRERETTGGISLRLFYIRRALRIWPLYFLIVALGVVFAHTNSTGSFRWFYYQRLSWYYVSGYLLFVGNWVYAVFGPAESICAPLWTVSIEEQFYLLWPAIMKGLARRGILIAGIVTFLLSTASQVGIVLVGANRHYIEYGSASRFNSLAVGILMALWAPRLLTSTTSRLRMVLFAGGLIAWIGAYSARLTEQPGAASMRAVLARLMVSLASGAILCGCLNSRSKLLTGGWVVRLGKISYGLYMFHFTGIVLALTLVRPVSRPELLGTKALAFVVTLVLAFASYRWFESPFLRLKGRFTTVLSRPV